MVNGEELEVRHAGLTPPNFGDSTLRVLPQWRAYANSTEHGGLRHRLFINPWDPHTLVGNGNFMDASMDGSARHSC